MEETKVIITRGELIQVERTSSHTVEFYFQATSSPDGAAISGTGLWQLRVFANRRADGSHHLKAYKKDVILTSEQINMPLPAGSLIAFSSLNVSHFVKFILIVCAVFEIILKFL